jgi:hypothetical protein
MKIIYLKNETYNKQNRYSYCIKILSNGSTIDCDGEKISTDTFDGSLDEEVLSYTECLFFKLVEATKEEFDSLFKKTVKRINSLSNI